MPPPASLVQTVLLEPSLLAPDVSTARMGPLPLRLPLPPLLSAPLAVTTFIRPMLLMEFALNAALARYRTRTRMVALRVLRATTSPPLEAAWLALMAKLLPRPEAPRWDPALSALLERLLRRPPAISASTVPLRHTPTSMESARIARCIKFPRLAPPAARIAQLVSTPVPTSA